ncbi:endonuclease/exonuclease/phosphatase family protein [Clostridium fallax]|uniref:Metal-dependent hydrolase, endonuclease/exonuclease/phosphatase family n=1 Tax=Clostridium fallax TaxID=1533 RepID=A0A1M4YRD4_9CLOT|nr:endonuclease/exonuclease/phosphatase family protein [Clostridium fallax]SHF08354.1 Metal-dependent hydrolase, endonuclease/exonuclease/phosphatase family [Clostridium fallax]SQB06217.1 endonuclease/exonuclease/phosphatase family protein [Clostridium fallax]
MTINVMTFNLKYDFTNNKDNSWDERAERIEALIKENKPLVIGTQEGLIHMLKTLKNLLKEYDFLGEGREGGEEGAENEFNAIFYKKEKLSLINWGQFWLSKNPKEKGSKSFESSLPRICTWAHFKIKEINKEFIQYNTHLDHISQKAREEGIKIILNFIKRTYKENNIPYMLMGDFNCYKENEIFKIMKEWEEKQIILKNSYDEALNDVVCTFHEFKGGFEGGIIDYILFSKEFKINSVKVDSRKIKGGYPSDHYPVICNISLD